MTTTNRPTFMPLDPFDDLDHGTQTRSQSEQPAAPAYIAPDTYKGRWTIALGPNRRAAGYFAVHMTAAEIAAEAAQGVLWDSFGTPRGRRYEHFGRTRYVADSEGNLHCYNADGPKSSVYPADRVIRVLRMSADPSTESPS